MDTVASARIPVEIKRQGDAKLKQLGLNTTALIRAAYDYLLETGTVPQTRQAQTGAEGTRTLSEQQRWEFQQFMSRTTLPAPASWQGKTYEQLYEEAMRDRYPEYLG